MESEPVYTSEVLQERPDAASALAHPDRERSVVGRAAGMLTWTRTSSRAARAVAKKCPSTWGAFLKERDFTPLGGVARTYVFWPLFGHRALYFRSPDGLMLAAVRSSGPATDFSLWCVFDDGLIVTMSNQSTLSWIGRREMDPESFVRYPMSAEPKEAYQYFLDAIAYFESAGRTRVPFNESGELARLEREYWLRRPALGDLGNALGLVSTAWLIFVAVSLLRMFG